MATSHSDGLADGPGEGDTDGVRLGASDEIADGLSDGQDVGYADSEKDGEYEGRLVGISDGASDGMRDGIRVGVERVVGDPVCGGPRVVFSRDHGTIAGLSHSQQHCVQHSHIISSQSAVIVSDKRLAHICEGIPPTKLFWCRLISTKEESSDNSEGTVPTMKFSWRDRCSIGKC